MEPAEVLHRVGEKGRKLVSRRRHQGWARFPACRLYPVFPAVAAKVSGASAKQCEAIRGASEAILSGRFSALGREWPLRDNVDLFPQELWRLDPVTGKSWPGADIYCFDIDFRHDGTMGDVKYVWELNRLQFLPVLAAYHVLAGNLADLSAIEAAIASWHGANPPFGGVAWASGIEVALRSISLILVLDLVGSSLSGRSRSLIAQILAASAFWLRRYPSRFSSANNHLVAELTGEYLIGRAFGDHLGPVWDQLLEELDKQILPDGGGAEQTPSYAAFTAELVLLATMAAHDAGMVLPEASRDRLAAFADYLTWIGPGARFGDDDEGQVLRLGEEANYPHSVAAAIAALLGTPAALCHAEDFRALVFGQASQSAAKPRGLRTFDDAGLSVWQGEMAGREAVLHFDHGPLGYLSIAAHGHADALAVTLALDGLPILVDPGTYLYGSGGAWRSWFRSTPAHNTLNLGQSQSTMSGAFNWSHKAQARLLSRVEGPDWELVGEHDGYQRHFGTLHRRSLKRQGPELAVRDCLLGAAREAEIVFQLAPGLKAEQEGARVLVSRCGAPLLEMTLPDDNLRIRAGGDNPGEGGWVSLRFGHRVPAPRVAWKGKVDQAGVLTRISVLGR